MNVPVKFVSIDPTKAWSACSAICANRNLALRELSRSKGKSDSFQKPGLTIVSIKIRYDLVN